MLYFQQDITVNKMKLSDVKTVIQVHKQAFPEIPSTILGDRYLTAYMQWFINDAQSIVLTGYLNHEIAGYVVGSPQGYERSLNKSLSKVVMKEFLFRPYLLIHKSIRKRLLEGLRMLRQAQPAIKETDKTKDYPDQRVMVLISVGVATRARGKRIGSTIMEAFEIAAQERGFHEMRLYVASNNSVARHLYEGYGWMPLSSTKTGALLYKDISATKK